MFDMRIVRYEEEVENLYRSQTMVLQVEELMGRIGWYGLRFCGLSRPYDCFHMKKDAVDWWRELSFECRQRTNVRRRQFIGWHILKVIDIPQNERIVYFGKVQDE